ncbi:unnamed protein product [Urochloa humidicola]
MERATFPPSRPKRRRCKIDVDVWLSLPPELLGEIFRRLDTVTDVVSCAGTCKQWRRTIIDNASRLRLRPNCFNPNLLIGFFYKWNGMFLQRVPGPFQSTLPAITGGEEGHYERAGNLIPAANTGGIDLTLYNSLLSSRDGFLLLESCNRHVVDLCLCNPMTGSCTFLPRAAFRAHAYILVIGDNLSPSEPDDVASQILIVAVKCKYRDDIRTFKYQYFSSTSSFVTGSWGPVMRSEEIVNKHLVVRIDRGVEVVSGGTIYWLGHSDYKAPDYLAVVALDVRTGCTRTIGLPNECRTQFHSDRHVLATTSNGRLSLLQSAQRCGNKDHIQVWMHLKGVRWILQRTIEVPNICFQNDIFWPRSGCLLVEDKGGQALLIDIETGLSRPITCLPTTLPNYCRSCYPYEMDWPTYLSKMDPFVTARARIYTKPMKRRVWRPNPKIYGPNWVN